MPRLYVDEYNYIEVSGNPLTQEIATRNRSLDFLGLNGWLPNPDPILRKLGKDMSAYRDLLSDTEVGSAVQRRKAGTIAKSWYIDREGADIEPANIIEQQLTKLDIKGAVSAVLNAPLFGHQEIEVVWDYVGGVLLPVKIEGKPQEWFGFDSSNRLRFLCRGQVEGMIVPPKKFLLVQHNEDYLNPYGEALLGRCFWPVTFRKGGIKFWINFTERYGQPWVIAKYARGTDYTKLLETVEQMVQDAILILPNDSEAEVVPTGSSANAEIFRLLLEWCDNQISKNLLWHDAAMTSTPGKLGGEDGALGALEYIVDASDELVTVTMNELVGWIYELNWPRARRAQFALYKKADINRDRADRDRVLYDMGVRPRKSYWINNYSLSDDEFDVVESPSTETPPALFSECPRCSGNHAEATDSSRELTPAADPASFPDQRAVDNLHGKLTPEQQQYQMEQVLSPIMKLVGGANSYGEIMEGLVGQFPAMNTRDLEAVLERALFITETVGRLSADGDTRD